MSKSVPKEVGTYPNRLAEIAMASGFVKDCKPDYCRIGKYLECPSSQVKYLFEGRRMPDFDMMMRLTAWAGYFESVTQNITDIYPGMYKDFCGWRWKVTQKNNEGL